MHKMRYPKIVPLLTNFLFVAIKSYVKARTFFCSLWSKFFSDYPLSFQNLTQLSQASMMFSGKKYATCISAPKYCKEEQCTLSRPQTGHIRQRKNGLWEGQYIYKKERKKHKRRYHGSWIKLSHLSKKETTSGQISIRCFPG